MKSREELQALTKDQLEAYGRESFGHELDKRHTKESLVEEVLAVQQKHADAFPHTGGGHDQPEPDAPADNGADDPDAQAPGPDDATDPAATAEGDATVEASDEDAGASAAVAANQAPEGMVRITVTYFRGQDHMPLSVNGRRFVFPVGEPKTVPVWVLPTLRAVGNAQFTQE